LDVDFKRVSIDPENGFQEVKMAHNQEKKWFIALDVFWKSSQMLYKGTAAVCAF
jgi:hypothetical protein